MIAGQGRTVTYTAFNMADTITQGSSVVALVYDANHARIKQTAPDGTTIYVAGPVGVERFAATSGLVQWNEYLMAGGQMVGVHFTRSDATQNTRHFVTDHLGSVAILTDEMGAVVERLSYDAWGKRRYANGADDPSGSITSQTTKGFTGHEHIAAVGLINMNARIYDPTIGRFMTPDSVVQDFYLSQILNRYTYVGNNPLSFTDPTGHLFGIDDIIVVVAVLVLSPIIKQIPILGSIAVIAASLSCGPACGAAASAAVTGVQGGDAGDIVKAFVLTYLEAQAFDFAGDLVGTGTATADVAKRFVVHGAVGGTFSALRGGDFGSGFLAAGISSLGHGVNLGDKIANAAFHAVLGGVGSVAGGGKFADGAITGAFGYLFNEAAHSERQQPDCLVSNFCDDLLYESPDAYGNNQCRENPVCIGILLIPVAVVGVAACAVTWCEGWLPPLLGLGEAGAAATTSAGTFDAIAVSTGRALPEWGKVIMWGTGRTAAADTIAVTETLTPQTVAAMRAQGLTYDVAVSFRNAYQAAAAAGTGGATAPARAAMMQRILDLW